MDTGQSLQGGKTARTHQGLELHVLLLKNQSRKVTVACSRARERQHRNRRFQTQAEVQ